MPTNHLVTTGLDRLLADNGGPLAGRRIGLATHAAAVTADLRHGLDALLAAGVDVRAVFGPEHGFRGTAQAGASVNSGLDAATGVPVHDIYAVRGDALAEVISGAGIDVIVVDFQHVGARFYTYESTLFDIIEAAARSSVAVTVLDRPNPLGGRIIQGPTLDSAFSSFVGRAPIPIRHGLTMGELAQLFSDMLGADRPEIIPMLGWARELTFGGTGLPWVPPSPNMPTPGTAACYPGTCLLEGTNLSLGRGTTTPFELCGAPWIDHGLAAELNDLGLPGVKFREACFTPTFDRYAGEDVQGVQLHVVNADVFDPLHTAVTMLEVLLRRWPHKLEFLPSSFDRLAGTDGLRLALLAGASAADVVAEWAPGVDDFRRLRAPYLRYTDLHESASTVEAAR